MKTIFLPTPTDAVVNFDADDPDWLTLTGDSYEIELFVDYTKSYDNDYISIIEFFRQKCFAIEMGESKYCFISLEEFDTAFGIDIPLDWTLKVLNINDSNTIKDVGITKATFNLQPGSRLRIVED